MKPSTQIYPSDSNKSTRPILSDMLYAIPHTNVERRAPYFKHDWYDKHDYLRLIYWRLMPYNMFFFTVSSELHMLIRLSISNNNWFQVSKQFNFFLEYKKAFCLISMRRYRSAKATFTSIRTHVQYAHIKWYCNSCTGKKQPLAWK